MATYARVDTACLLLDTVSGAVLILRPVDGHRGLNPTQIGTSAFSFAAKTSLPTSSTSTLPSSLTTAPTASTSRWCLRGWWWLLVVVSSSAAAASSSSLLTLLTLLAPLLRFWLGLEGPALIVLDHFGTTFSTAGLLVTSGLSACNAQESKQKERLGRNHDEGT